MGLKLAHGLSFVVGRQVSIPLNHIQGAVSQKFHYSDQIYTTHHEMGSERVPESVMSDVLLDACSPSSASDRASQILPGLAASLSKDVRAGNVSWNSIQDLEDIVIYWYFSGLGVLGVGQVNKPVLKVALLHKSLRRVGLSPMG